MAQFPFEQYCLEYLGLPYNLTWLLAFEHFLGDSFDDDTATVFINEFDRSKHGNKKKS